MKLYWEEMDDRMNYKYQEFLVQYRKMSYSSLQD